MIQIAELTYWGLWFNYAAYYLGATEYSSGKYAPRALCVSLQDEHTDTLNDAHSTHDGGYHYSFPRQTAKTETAKIRAKNNGRYDLLYIHLAPICAVPDWSTFHKTDFVAVAVFGSLSEGIL